MTLIESVPRVVRVECDAFNCDAVLLPPRRDMSVYGRDADAFISGHGWSVWVSRSRRYYCPAHGPRSGSKLRRVL
jgi:hypothetical protein